MNSKNNLKITLRLKLTLMQMFKMKNRTKRNKARTKVAYPVIVGKAQLAILIFYLLLFITFWMDLLLELPSLLEKETHTSPLSLQYMLIKSLEKWEMLVYFLKTNSTQCRLSFATESST